MPAHQTEPCVCLPWDSEFFGVRIGRVNETRLRADTAVHVQAWAKENEIDCLYFLAEMDDVETVIHAKRAGFMLHDIRVLLEAKRSSPRYRPVYDGNEITLRDAEPGDVPALRRIASSVHTDTRFYHDPNFANEKCDELYATWIEKCCANEYQTVLVALWNGRPAGYFAYFVDPDSICAHIDLVGVDPAYHGKGIGSVLASHAMDRIDQSRAQTVRVVTQGRNMAAQGLYQRFGFTTVAMHLWYHWWRD